MPHNTNVLFANGEPGYVFNRHIVLTIPTDLIHQKCRPTKFFGDFPKRGGGGYFETAFFALALMTPTITVDIAPAAHPAITANLVPAPKLSESM